jgi:hypothetical protein
MARKRNKREINLLDLIPIPIIGHEVNDDGIVTLFAPRFKSRILRRWLLPRLKRPFFRVELDDVGSALWLLCDGNRNVKEIARGMRERFAERIEPCYERMGLFFQQLEGARFITYKNLDMCYVERPEGES